MFEREPTLWAIILAGGDGTRLASLTRALYGTERPKQFAVLTGSRSMLQATVDRILPMVPPERIVVVVTRHHEVLAREQLAAWGGAITLLVQPRNLDTAPGLLLPLSWIRARDRDARVVVLPADHHVAQPRALLDALHMAADSTRRRRNHVSLVGAEPDSPDTEYGWIVPGRRLGRSGTRAVQRFFEKPGPELAEELLGLGALWNTFIMVGSIEALWRESEQHLPEHAAGLARCALPHELERVYTTLPPANFSRAVLERARNLTLTPLRGAGWSDWGTPRRVLASLAGTDDHAHLLRRMAEPASRRAVA